MSGTPEHDTLKAARKRMHASVDQYFNSIEGDVIAKPKEWAKHTVRQHVEEACDNIPEM